MANEFLKSFLKTGLFEIGDSDDRLKKLQKSITDLQRLFKKDYSLLPKYTLIAIDPNISDTEPALIATEEIVLKHWETLRSKYPEMPRNILRGVILNALNNIGSANPIAARIIYLSASNFYPYAKLSKEKELIETMLSELGNLAEKHATEEWALIEEEPSLKIGSLKITDFKFGDVKLNSEQLNSAMLTAIKNEPNGHGTPHGGDSVWGQHFAKKSSEGILNALQTAFNEFNRTLSPTFIEAPINRFFTSFKKTLDTNLKSSFSSLTAIERRSKLLWWKEALYSSLLKKSYRELDNNLLPIVMSLDLNNQLPVVTPISVDYLLKDTLFLLNDKKNETIKFTDFLEAISKDSLKNILKPFFPDLSEEDGRISITDFIGLLVNDKLSIKDFQSRTGIKVKNESNISEIAVYILHDLLTQKLIEA